MPVSESKSEETGSSHFPSLGRVALETWVPCCEEAQAASWSGPIERNKEPGQQLQLMARIRDLSHECGIWEEDPLALAGPYWQVVQRAETCRPHQTLPRSHIPEQNR